MAASAPSKPIDFSSYLPAELCYYLFSHFGPNDLATLSLCSHRLRTFASSNIVWAPLCQWRWKGKQGLHEILEVSHKNWWKVEGSWKRAYAVVELESKRTRPHVSDMTESKWSFRFHNHQVPFLGHPEFHADFKYTHPALMNGNFDWRITKSGQIQVAQYPYLIPSRADNWSWRLQNIYVHFASLDNTGFKRALAAFDHVLAVEAGELAESLVDEDRDPAMILAPEYDVKGHTTGLSSHAQRSRGIPAEGMDSDDDEMYMMEEQFAIYFF
ncbi:hypothetical protein BC938DRAFT_472115 [Jimgerdemannia flammicorona]|uniref:F-box domain-containing protein n=1 Tax=Jimgerdemannia flammicorona TaxID=994334 RepID=A0A433Q6S1_9FUNG|nr:hypothetical protein BC938DRAFT_472115 [Jimgerdemannia flammicorona]